MLHRTFGKTGWSVSVVGLGTWGLGGQWGHVSDRQAIETIEAAYDAGVNFFDTADAYGEPPGRSEELLGQALRRLRDKVYIATKVGNWARRFGQPLPYTDPLHVELCCDASLYRLRTDYIDLYQCHMADPPHPEVFLEAFDRLLKKGKICAWGISTDAVAAVRKMNSDGKCTAVQLDYSVVNRSAESELLPYCRSAGLAVIVRGPLARGLAAGKFSEQTIFTDSVRKGWNDPGGREKYLQRLALMEKLRFLDRPGRTLAQAALQFVISHPAVTVAIPGAKDASQARMNAAAGATTLSEEELQRIRSVTTA